MQHTPPPIRQGQLSRTRQQNELISDNFWWITLIVLAAIGLLFLVLLFFLFPPGSGRGPGQVSGQTSGDGTLPGGQPSTGENLGNQPQATKDAVSANTSNAQQVTDSEQKTSSNLDDESEAVANSQIGEPAESDSPQALDGISQDKAAASASDGDQNPLEPKRRTIDFGAPEPSAKAGKEKDEEDQPVGVPEIGLFSEAEAGFFGIKVRAEKVAFVVDASSSMASPLPESGETKFNRTKQELLSSLRGLSKKQEFSVILFNHLPIYDRNFELVRPTDGKIKDLENSLNNIFPFGGTDPSGALQSVLQSDHDVIFLLSDGEFDPLLIDWVRNANTGHKMICTICLGTEAITLQNIAKDSGGQYRSVR